MADKLTYAQKAKQIISKYENRLGKNLKEFDALSQESMMKELNDLKAHQEAFKSVQDAEQNPIVSEMAKGGWIKKAINPSHKGYCTPMTKSTCTPHRKALARRFKSGDLSHKADGGHLYGDLQLDESYFSNPGDYQLYLADQSLVHPVDYNYKSTIDQKDEVLQLGNVESNTSQWFSDPNNQAMLMQSIPALVNVGRGLFGNVDTVDLPDRTVGKRVTSPKMDVSEELRNIESGVNVSRRNLRNSMSGQIAAQVAGNKQSAEVFQRKYNADAQSQFQADTANLGIEEFNAQMLANNDFREQQMNDAAKAVKEGMLTTGLSQLSTIGQNYTQNKLYSDALESSNTNQRAALKQSSEQFDKTLKQSAESTRAFIDATTQKPTGTLVVDVPDATKDTTPKQGVPITAESDKTSFDNSMKTLVPEQYEPMVQDSVNSWGINKDLFTKQLYQESGFNPNNPSKDKDGNIIANGISQFTPDTLKSVVAQYNKDPNSTMNITEDDFYTNPQVQIELGAYHMAKLAEQYGSEEMALVAYNGGEGAVYWGKSADSETAKKMYKDPANPTIQEWVAYAESQPVSKDSKAWRNQTLDYVKKITGIKGGSSQIADKKVDKQETLNNISNVARALTVIEAQEEQLLNSGNWQDYARVHNSAEQLRRKQKELNTLLYQ